MSIGLITAIVLAVILAIILLLLSRTPQGCMLIKCAPELIACLLDEESRKGLQAMVECGNPNSERIQSQQAELKHLENGMTTSS